MERTPRHLCLIECILSFFLPVLLLACGPAPAEPWSGAARDQPAAADQPREGVQPVEPVGPGREATQPAVAVTEGCPAATQPLVTGTAVFAAPSLAEPAPREWFVDPSFGTCLVRVTDRRCDVLPDDGSAGMVNDYSRVQSFNADGTRLLVYGIDGTWYLYETLTLLPLRRLALGDEPRWDAKDPHKLYHISETRLLRYDVDTGAEDLVRDFYQDLPDKDVAMVWTRHEGSPSYDGRYWALMAEDRDWVPTAFLVYDLQADQVVVRDVRGLPGIEDDVDHVSISPFGTYFLASFDLSCPEGRLGDDGHPCGLMVYDRDLTRGRSLLRIIGHYDAALTADGREVIVYQDIDSDHISMLDLESGVVTPLWAIDFSHTGLGFHFSGLAYDRPGWVVVSTHDADPATYTWMDDQVFLVELQAGGRVVRMAHTHSLVDDAQELDYWAEPHASTNRDLTRILFSSNWGRGGSGEVDVYLIQLTQDWLQQLDAGLQKPTAQPSLRGSDPPHRTPRSGSTAITWPPPNPGEKVASGCTS